jgi:hypothetical protein
VAEQGPQTIPITFAPGVVRTSTPAGAGAQWYDSHLMRWVLGRMRPIGGWERMDLPPFPSKIRAMHVWTDLNGQERTAIFCETHLFVLEGPDVPGNADQFHDITPTGGIIAPPNNAIGGYGDDPYGANPATVEVPPFVPNTYGTPRRARRDRRRLGEIWKLGNFGEDLVAMSSADGRLLRWKPHPTGTLAIPVPTAPTGNRTFVITAERHVMLFGMGGEVNKFGWCDQENIDDWDFMSQENTAGFYSVEPANRIVCAMQAQYAIIFWTTSGAYVVEYKALPYIYTYSYLGQYTAPISGLAPAVYSGTVMWPSLDGFWRFDGSQIQQVQCPVLDWFQETSDDTQTRLYMAGWLNGVNSEIWWCFPRKPEGNEPAARENNTLIVYNFREQWWSIGKLARTCGIAGMSLGYPLMASVDTVYRHEKGHVYPDPDPNFELPWIRSGAIGLSGGINMATTKQILVDTDAELDAVSYQLFATKGRYQDAPERTKGPKLPATRRTHTLDVRNQQGKIDYRLTGRDFSIKMQTMGQKSWTFGTGQVIVTSRGKRGGP